MEKNTSESIDTVHNHREIPQAYREHSSPRVWPQSVERSKIHLHPGLCPALLCLLPFFSPDDSSSIPCSKPLGIDRDSTGVSKDEINKESVAMNSTLAQPNMTGRIIICQTTRRGHEFLRATFAPNGPPSRRCPQRDSQRSHFSQQPAGVWD